MLSLAGRKPKLSRKVMGSFHSSKHVGLRILFRPACQIMLSAGYADARGHAVEWTVQTVQTCKHPPLQASILPG